MENIQSLATTDSQQVRFGNLLKVLNTVLLTFIAVLLWQQAQHTSVSQLEHRISSNLMYLEGRINDLAAKLDKDSVQMERRVDILVARISSRPKGRYFP